MADKMQGMNALAKTIEKSTLMPGEAERAEPVYLLSPPGSSEMSQVSRTRTDVVRNRVRGCCRSGGEVGAAGEVVDGGLVGAGGGA